MLVRVTLYGTLRVITGRQVLEMSFDGSSTTISELLQRLVALYPRVEPYLLEASSHRLHTEMRVLLNGKRPPTGVTLATPLYDKDRITFLVTSH